MSSLKAIQRSYLRRLAHGLQPVIQIGRAGLTEGVLQAIDTCLRDHELIKIRFGDHKEHKETLSGEIGRRLEAELVARIGHVAVFFRPHPDPSRRKIHLPERPGRTPR